MTSNTRATHISRRSALALLGLCTAGAGLTPVNLEAQERRLNPGRIKQSVVHWCFKPMSAEELAMEAAKLGLASVELVTPEFWPMLKKHGLTCAIAPSHGFAKGFAQPGEHDECLKILRERIDAAAEFGVPNVITFSGFSNGLRHEDCLKNTIEGLKKIVGYAEQKKVTLCIEMLNTRVDVTMKGHPGYFLDNIETAVDLCKTIGSERMKVLFDIYHVQIMHGDLIARIKKHLPYIGHIHTAGNPGRNELDDKQEINYPAVMKAIAETSYNGFVGQEFIPVRDNKIASLAEAVRLCNV
jgi:hydroxypyruvate isomerase